MPQENDTRNQELADALLKLSGGPNPATPAPQERPDDPESQRDAAQQPSSKRPTAPGTSSTAPLPNTVIKPPPSPPGTPSTSQGSSLNQKLRGFLKPSPKRSKRPFAPQAPSQRAVEFVPVIGGDVPSDATGQTDDDDAVIVPAPSVDAFIPKPASPTLRTAAPPSLFLRRTLIPILLTAGVMLPVLGGLWFTTEIDSPFRDAGIWVPCTLIIVGIALLALGLLNAIHVKDRLEATKREATRAAAVR
jgi:hypothetical protein